MPDGLMARLRAGLLGTSPLEALAVVAREVIAGRIIGAARFGERDPVRLRAAALSGIGRRD
jgi:hypothetical protein